MDYYRPTLELPIGGRATEVKNTGQSCRRARWRVELLSEETVFDFLFSWPLQTNTLAWSYIMLITST